MKNLQLAVVLTEIGDMLELLGENPFRIRAYRRASRSIELLPESIETIWREGRLDEVEGVGKGIAAGIEQWLKTGTIDYYEELQTQVPRGLLEVTRVPGVGPKRARLLHDELGIGSLEELEQARRGGPRAHGERAGGKNEENILKGIERLRRHSERLPLGVALPIARSLVDELQKVPVVQRVAYTGSARRGRETVGDIDIIASSEHAAAVIEAFVGIAGVQDVLAKGQEKASVILAQGMQVDLLVVQDHQFASALHHFTGSKEHNITMRELARGRGLRISEHGILMKRRIQCFPSRPRPMYLPHWICPSFRRSCGKTVPKYPWLGTEPAASHRGR